MAKKTAGRDWIAKAGPYEILSLAIEMEHGAMKRYGEMAKSAEHRLARAKFRYLAEEEREHARVLSAARREVLQPEKSARAPSVTEGGGRPREDTPEGALRVALDAEHDAEAFYRDCSARCRGREARTLFLLLAEQESRHARILDEELKLLDGLGGWRGIAGTAPDEQDFWTRGS